MRGIAHKGAVKRGDRSKVSEAQRQEILSTYEKYGFKAAKAVCESLGLSDRYHNNLASVRGISIMKPRPTIFEVSEIISQLRKTRLEMGISQDSVAAMLGNNAHGYISNVENGRKTPTLPTVARWADALGYRLVLEPKE